MENRTLGQATAYKNRIEELNGHLRLIESAKIKSLTARIFNNETCEYEEEEVDIMPRGKVKAILVQHYQAEIKNLKEKIEKL